jgi:UDP-glucose 4-epimerase
MVQKSPASTVGDLAQALIELFHSNSKIKIIGTRHGEKLYETLLTKEEYAVAKDLGKFFVIPADKRYLYYDKYCVEGDPRFSYEEEYNSHITDRLDIEQIKKKLLSLEYVKNELKDWNK